MTPEPDTKTAEETDARHAQKMAKKKAARDKIMATKSGEKGLIIVHTGAGKGKSSSAFGMIVRCVAHGFPCAVVQFIKGAWDTGERRLLTGHFGDLCQFHAMGEGFTWETQDRARDVAAARAGWEKAKELILDPDVRMVVLDEINIALRYDYLDIAEIVEFLTTSKPPMTHVVLTGRNAKDELIEIADLVTEMTLIKHPFRSGIKAQAGVEPHTDMNPVLLKPETDVGSQVIVQGKRIATARARDYAAMKPQLMGAVLESFERLKARADLVLVEGAGSPAEVNLRKADIANMGFARRADVPVVLIGDIDRGGVIAQLVGIKTVIDPDDAAMIRGFVINKFRGDPTLFDDGYRLIEQSTAWRGFGVLPWFARAGELPAEDALGLSDARKPGQCKIACLALSRIANFDDLDPLKLEPGVDLVMVRPGEAIPGDVRLVIIPGSKSTRGDLAFLRAQGWDIDLFAHHRRGGHVLGLCGGYQMLGHSVADPEGIEGPAGNTPGLALLDVETVMSPQKTLTRVAAVHAATEQPIQAYEIHIGRTDGPDRAHPFARLNGEPEGAISRDGRIQGSYLHGLFTSDDFRKAYLARLDIPAGNEPYHARVESALDALADHIEQHLDVEGLLALAR